MTIRLLTLIVTVACFAAACGGDGNSARAVRTPAPAAPRDVIAFGAQDAAGQHALHVVLPDGTGLQELTSEVQAVSFPRWSPDGDRIAYIVAGGRGPGTKAALRVFDFDGAITTTISEDLLASGDEAPFAWSPDGTRLAFIDTVAEGTLRLYDIDSREIISGPAIRATSVDWSANDELAIVAQGEDESTADIYTLEPGDEQPSLRLERDGIEGALAWSRDGETLAFWAGETNDIAQRALFLLSNDDDPQELGPGTDPSWSKTGRLAYSAPPAPGQRGALDIYIDGVDGAEPARLSQSITLDRWPSWSPQEDAIAYLAEADASTTFLCLIELATQDNTCLNLPGLTPSAPAWSPY